MNNSLFMFLFGFFLAVVLMALAPFDVRLFFMMIGIFGLLTLGILGFVISFKNAKTCLNYD